VPDRLIWHWSTSGQYSMSSAYNALFYGQSAVLGSKELWKMRVPRKCVFFLWMAILGRCLTSERLHRHGLKENSLCAFCYHHDESADHLFFGCMLNREVWILTLRRCGWQDLTPNHGDHLLKWWLAARKWVQKE
jgi:hypothetical protein